MTLQKQCTIVYNNTSIVITVTGLADDSDRPAQSCRSEGFRTAKRDGFALGSRKVGIECCIQVCDQKILFQDSSRSTGGSDWLARIDF